MLREDFIEYMFDYQMYIDVHLIPILTISIQMADEYVVNTNLQYSKILGRSCYNIAFKYYHDDSYGMLDYTKKVIELHVLKNITVIPRFNFLTNIMSILTNNEFDNMDHGFIFHMMKELCMKRLHNSNPFTLLLAMKLLYDKDRLSFIK